MGVSGVPRVLALALWRLRLLLLGAADLKAVNVPESVKTIGEMAFAGCNSLEAITLSESTQVADDAFPPSTKITRLSAEAMAFVQDGGFLTEREGDAPESDKLTA